MIVSKVATQSNQTTTTKQGVTFTDEPASQASHPVTSALVQQAKATAATQTANASVSANVKQQYVIPQKSTPSNTPASDQQAVGQIAQNKNLTLNRDTNQSVSLNANGQRVLTVSGVDNVVQKNGQTTVYSYNNGQVHQFDKNLNMTSGPSDHTVLQNDGKNAIYISDGNSYQPNGYPESYARLIKNKNGLELQKILTRSTYTFTQEGKENCSFPGKPTVQKVINYQVNNNNSITVTFENGTTQVLSNNWIKSVPLSNIDTNTSHDDSSKDKEENKLASESISDINSAYNKLPNETYNQTITFHDDVTGGSKTITTFMQVKKGDKYIVYNTDLRLPYGYYLDCNNLVKNNPNSLDQTNEKFSYNIVNPYNVKKEDFNTQISTLNGKNFPIYNSLSGNSIVNLKRPIVVPGVSGFSKLNIHFIDKNGKEIGSQLIDPNSLSNQVENDWAAYAYRVNVPKGYKFVDPRENYVAYTSQGSTKQNNLEWNFNYPVELAVNSTTNNHSDSTSSTNQPAKGISDSSASNVQKANPDGTVTYVDSRTGKTVVGFKNSWLTQAKSNGDTEPSMSGSNLTSNNETNESNLINNLPTNGVNTNSPVGANGSSSMAGENGNLDSQTLNDLHNSVSSNTNISTSINKNIHQATSAHKPAAAKASQTKGSQAGGHTASVGKTIAGKCSVSASASAGKTSATPTNKTSQESAAVKSSVSASKTSTSVGKTQAQSQSANGSAAKGSVSVNQSSAASQLDKSNQWQSQGQHVNVIKHPAKVVKASAPVVQLAAKQIASAPTEETTASVAEQASTPVETAAPVVQKTASAPAAKTATSSVVQSSNSSLSSMPNTGMDNEVAAELGMVGAGLVLELAAKRKNKEK